MKKKLLFSLYLMSISLIGTVAIAAPTLITLGDFSASDTLVTFNSLANEELITTQFTGQGVTFSGSLYGMTASGDTPQFPSNGGGVIASNWLYSQSRYAGLSFTANFTTEITRVGFYLENWPVQTARVELFDGANSLGFINYNTASLTAQFLGIQETSGFNRMIFTNNTEDNGFFAIDDLRYNAGNIVTTPEPTTMLLLGFGLAGLAGVRRFKK
jgi:hypothetical protein